MTTEKTERFLTINRKLEVRLDGDEGKYYKSYVLGVQENLFLINPPYVGRNDLMLRVGDNVEVVLLSDKEKYLFVAPVVQRVQNPLKGYILQAPEEARRIQLRAFVRIKVALEAEWTALPEGIPNKKEWENLRFSKAVMVDLSGGGAALVTDKLLPEGVRILLRFTMEIRDEKRSLALVSEVCRSSSLNEKRKYSIGVKFLGISEKERDQIIEYVFYKQRKQYFLDEE